MLERIRAVPGVEGAGVTTTLPFSGSYSDSVILAEGYQMQPGESLISPSQVVASDGLLRGDGRDARRRPLSSPRMTSRGARAC